MAMDEQHCDLSPTRQSTAAVHSRAPFSLAVLVGLFVVVRHVMSASWGQAPRATNDQASSKATPGQGAIANDDDPRVKAAVAKAVAYLRSRAGEIRQLGPISLTAHALAKVRAKYPDIVGPNDGTLQGMIGEIRSHCGNPFQPNDNPENYVAASAAMALSAAGGEAFKAELTSVAQYLIDRQLSNGAWSYSGEAPGGDTSQTQYAILGLWEAGDGAGVPIPPEVWDKAANWLISTQKADGGFAYHPKDLKSDYNDGRPTHTMTMASLGSLYICRDHLAGGKRKNTRGVLMPVQEKSEASDYTPQVKPGALDGSLSRAAAWMASNFVIEKPRGAVDSGGTRWVYYYLYALERYATLANLSQINNTNWYAKGAELVLSKQREDGSWRLEQSDREGPEIQTSFAILFLIRSTVVSRIIHERRLGRGTLVSSRGLPSNLAELEQAGNKLKAKEIKGRAGDLLGIIESGNAGQAEGAAIGLAKSMYEKKWTAGGEEGDKLRKLLQKGFQTKNSEVIKTTFRLLALTGDYRVVPLLIDGMYFEDDAEVQLSAREALCLISRKFHGFGYSDEPTLEEWKEEIEKWQAWYRSVRPQAEIEDDLLEIK